jgi:DNA-binding ferritin-like protein
MNFIIYDFVVKLLELKNLIQILHWTTSSYSKHKATDKLIESLQSLTDKFTEVAIGKNIISKKELRKYYLKYKFLNSNINNNENIENFVDKIIEKIYDIKNKIDNVSNSDLLNILDEILAEINQFKYLLSFH